MVCSWVGTVVADLYGAPTSKDARRLRTTLALGEERTVDQDPAFAIRVMVDIAIRALSPAVNDPTTATQVINGDVRLTLPQLVRLGHGLGCPSEDRRPHVDARP